jgi:Arc/MetJ family transcription regulator
MSRPSPTPDVKARWHSEAIAAIGRRLRLVYLASDYSAVPARLKRLLKALDRREPEHASRGGLTARTQESPRSDERDNAG